MTNKKDFYSNFSEAIRVLRILEEAGFEAYFVGGCVRDFVRGEEFSDIDITTSAHPEEVKKLFKKTIDTGLQHGTVTVLLGKEPYEVTTFRTESDYSNHRSPDKVEFVTDLKKDLDRRDFTINALALDRNGVLFDFHNGQLDLKNSLIKTVNDPNERFFEDALRMLRAFRFAAKLDFTIEELTLAAIEKNAELIKYVSIERVVVEFRKLLAGTASEKSLELLLRSKLHTHLPFLQDIKKYRNFSTFTFCQSLFWLSYFNGINLAKLKELKLSNKEIAQVKTYYKIHEEFLKNTELELVLYEFKEEDVIFVAELFGEFSKDEIEKIDLVIEDFTDAKVSSQKIIAIIDKKPGPWIKEVVAKVEKEILLRRLANDEKEIVDFLLKIRDNI